jgi:glucose-1-phosphate cytidylyltransferase
MTLRTLILAGGFGTRLSEETDRRPKPMVEIGGKPILWHILNIYGAAGFTDFVVALGYKGEVIREYFLNYRAHNHDLDIDLANGSVKVHDTVADRVPPWTLSLVDTGEGTETGGRILRLRDWLGDDDTFMLTYGDGVADIDVRRVVEFHRSHGKLATVTVARPPARFGAVTLEGDQVTAFGEKPQTGEGWINGGFFVLDRRVLDYIEGEHIVWERQPMERLAADGELMAYQHTGFWQPMDTLREKGLLESLWASGEAPWKVWA